MPRSSKSEAVLSRALAAALCRDREFAAWLLARTKFRAELAECVFVRADNPWGEVRLSRQDINAGTPDLTTRQCETDVLAVFLTEAGRRLALHIENKLASSSFTKLQPELYRARPTQWREKQNRGMYNEATSVLVAPLAFYSRNEAAARVFDAYVSHEDLAVHLSAFRGADGAA